MIASDQVDLPSGVHSHGLRTRGAQAIQPFRQSQECV